MRVGTRVLPGNQPVWAIPSVWRRYELAQRTYLSLLSALEEDGVEVQRRAAHEAKGWVD